MITYQDLLMVGEGDKERMEFVRRLISEHQSSGVYAEAMLADEYMRQQNRTIVNYQKYLRAMSGELVPDNYSANYKLCSNFFNRFITQQVQFLLGNGVVWEKPDTGDKLGDDFDTRLQEAGREALAGAVSFCFWNLDRVEVFHVREFAPLYDEENGAMMAGVRFWQIDSTKPLRATFYELDGYTDYIWRGNEDGEVLKEKRPYKLKVRTSQVDGTEIYDGENYDGLPIVPMWGNPNKQSELIGMRENIDAYDLIKSGFANDIDDASQIYWIMQGADGMDEVDLAAFLDQLRRVKAAVVGENGAKADPHTIEVPYEARERMLDRLRADMYEDYMALDTKNLADGAVTATQIEAAYEPINNKADQFEFCVLDCLKGILAVAGIDDSPSFTRSMIVNRQEEVQTVLQSAQYLSEDYVTEKLLTLLGDGDKLEEVLGQRDEADMNRMTQGNDEQAGNVEGEREEEEA